MFPCRHVCGYNTAIENKQYDFAGGGVRSSSMQSRRAITRFMQSRWFNANPFPCFVTNICKRDMKHSSLDAVPRRTLLSWNRCTATDICTVVQVGGGCSAVVACFWASTFKPLPDGVDGFVCRPPRA